MKIQSSTNMIESDTTDNDAISFNSSTYIYTKDDISNFFTSNNGQEEEHTLEESICKPLIETRSNKPFFYHCKEDPM